jgi:Cd2+/Zn2+-exporting ATPase
MNSFETKMDPTLPETGTRCTDVLSDTLRGYAGIKEAQLDLKNGHLSIQYDPHVLSDEHALKLVRRAGETAWDRVAACLQKNDRTCQACLSVMGTELLDHYKELARADLSVQAQYDQGIMDIKIREPGLPPAEVARVEKIFPPSDRKEPLVKGLPRGRVEIVLTIVTALAALLAFFGGQWGFLPAVYVTASYILAFAAGGFYGLKDGLSLLRQRRLDVNLLMILAALGAAIIGQPAEGAALLFLFSLSNTLQTYAMDRSRKAIGKLLDLRPSVATVRRGSRLETVPVEKLRLGEIVLVRPGERFPIDGEVVSGSSAVDQSTITGESMPVEKGAGAPVFAGTVNGTGALEIRVTHLAQDTTLAKIVQMVEQAQANKAQTQRMLDSFEQYYALLVLGGAFLLTIIPSALLQHPFYPTFYRAMTWLVVASPCALVISTPASILSAIANGARRGILFKGGAHLEQTANIKVVAFDKTGTLTNGTPSLAAVYTRQGVSEPDLLRLAAATESRSEHPLAAAILLAARTRGLEIPQANDFQAILGQGVEANVEGKAIWIGNERLFSERRVRIPEELMVQARQMELAGQTVMFVNADGDWLGLLAVADTLRPDAAEIVQELKRLGVEHVVMLTGDNDRVAASIANRTGVDEFHAGLLPQDKVRLLKVLRNRFGVTAMVGDGVNDAPALAVADVGIAMGGAGTDVALETADVVLMADNLAHLPYAIGLARRARRTVWQNLAFSLAVIVFLVATAFGAQLPLTMGVIGHEGSTVIVVLNGLRLLGFRPGTSL